MYIRCPQCKITYSVLKTQKEKIKCLDCHQEYYQNLNIINMDDYVFNAMKGLKPKCLKAH